jgi:hypothetical protein
MSMSDPDNSENILHCVVSPNGRLRIEQRTNCRETTEAAQVLWFFNHETSQVVTVLPEAEWQGQYEMSGDDLVMDFRYPGEHGRIRLGINTEDLMFYFSPHDYPEPLESLAAELMAMRKRK